MVRQLTEQEMISLEQLESYRFWLLLIAGGITLGATILSAYLAWKKPGI